MTPIPLLGRATYFDDIRYAPALGKVLVPPEGGGKLFVVDPTTRAVDTIDVGAGTASVDASATTIFTLDRSAARIDAIDAVSHAVVASATVGGSSDYLRVTPDGSQVWVTIPGGDRIEVFTFAGGQLAPSAGVPLPAGPEGLTFDGKGRAYTQSGGTLYPIDVANRVVVGEWSTGCGFAHGFPQVDTQYDLVIGGCSGSGGVSILTATGERRSGYEAGADAAILAYGEAKHHLYVRGDNGAKLDVVAVCPDGGTSVVGSVQLSKQGHGATADDQGHAWVVDATTGGVFQISDP